MLNKRQKRSATRAPAVLRSKLRQLTHCITPVKVTGSKRGIDAHNRFLYINTHTHTHRYSQMLSPCQSSLSMALPLSVKTEEAFCSLAISSPFTLVAGRVHPGGGWMAVGWVHGERAPLQLSDWITPRMKVGWRRSLGGDSSGSGDQVERQARQMQHRKTSPACCNVNQTETGWW